MKKEIVNNKRSRVSKTITHNSGITIVALIITVIVLLILATVAIQAVNGEGIIGKAKEARLKQEMVGLKEEYELWCTEKTIETLGEFSKEGVTATKEVLVYNEAQKENENIYNVIPSLEKSGYSERVEIIKGEMYVKTTDRNEVKWLQEIGIVPNPWNIVDGVLKSSETNLLLLGEDGTLVIPGSVKEIARGAFSNVEGIKKIIIPGTVKTIRDNAFSYNTTLEEVMIEDGVEKIEFQAFRGCTNLLKVEMTDSVSNLGNEPFSQCYSLQTVKLSNNISVLPSTAFYDCKNLVTLNLPIHLKKIDSSAFQYCRSLTQITIPSEVTNIAQNAFSGCTKLETIKIEEGNIHFVSQNGILFNSNQTEMIWISPAALNGNTFTIPNTITNLAAYQLEGYSQIKVVRIPASATNIDVDFFNTNIESVEIDKNNPNYEVKNGGIYLKKTPTLFAYFAKQSEAFIEEGTEEIGRKAFYYLRDYLQKVTLPNSVKRIKDFAFMSCNQMRILHLTENIEDISPTFIYGINNIQITIDENNLKYKVVDKGIYSKDGTRLITVMGNPTSFTILTGVKEIIRDAFLYKNAMNQVIIPNTVTKIDASFNSCGSLQTITIPSSVESISGVCFLNCTNLKEIQINKAEGSIAGAPWGATIGDRVKVIWNK